MGLISLIGLLFLAACNQQPVNKELKLLPCEEKEYENVIEPSFSESDQTWDFKRVKLKEGVLYSQSETFLDSTKKIMCEESSNTMTNFCKNKDTTITRSQSIHYGSSMLACDSICKRANVYNFSESRTIKIGDKIKSERLSLSQAGIPADKLIPFKREVVSDILKKGWSMAPEIKPFLDSLKFYGATISIIYDKNHTYCGAFFINMPINKATAPYDECIKKQAYQIFYVLAESN
jgi:hypothetical protein